MDFEIVASRWREIEEKSSVLEMTGILASLLKETPPGEVEWVVYLCQCQVAPPYKGVDLGVGEKLLMNAIAKATGYQRAEIEKMFTDSGDLGLVAEKLVGGRRQRPLFSERLSVKKVYETLYKIAASSGEGSQNAKVNGVVELLNAATPLEARYLARLPTGELRLGIRDPTILNALSLIASGTKELREEIEDKYNIHPDLGEIAREFLSKGAGALKKISIELGVPIRPALCERLSSAEEILEKMNGKTAVDSKYDGFRLQVHKKGSKVMLFSRQMEDMTAMFPDVVAGVLAQVKARDCVLDCEALAFDAKTSQFFPFQTTMQRRRKHGIDAMAKKYPLKAFVFDVLYLNGKNLISEPYSRRRKLLEENLKKGETLLPSDQIIASTPGELDKFFNSLIERGLEGIIAKKLDAPYIPGKRKMAWVKLKRDYQQTLGDTIDVVIVGYYKGGGVRAQFGLGGLLAAVYDDEKDLFKTISKIGTGFTEEQLKRFSEVLARSSRKEKPASVESIEKPDVWVEPRHVVTVKAAEITRSSIHTCRRDFENEGYALRFPRIIGDFREDKKPEDATTVEEIVEMFSLQKRQRTNFTFGETEEES